MIHVDAGDYAPSHNTLLLAQDSGVTLRGAGAAASAPTARLNRNSTSPTAIVLDFRGADDVTIDHLAIAGG